MTLYTITWTLIDAKAEKLPFLRIDLMLNSTGAGSVRPRLLPDARRPGEEPHPQTPAGLRPGGARPRHDHLPGPQPGKCSPALKGTCVKFGLILFFKLAKASHTAHKKH